MSKLKSLILKWLIVIILIICLINLPVIFLVKTNMAEKIIISELVILLIFAVLGWLHFRIELNSIKRKNKTVVFDEDIKFYGFDPKEDNAQIKARWKKIMVFELIMLTCMLVAFLFEIPFF